MILRSQPRCPLGHLCSTRNPAWALCINQPKQNERHVVQASSQPPSRHLSPATIPRQLKSFRRLASDCDSGPALVGRRMMGEFLCPSLPPFPNRKSSPSAQCNVKAKNELLPTCPLCPARVLHGPANSNTSNPEHVLCLITFCMPRMPFPLGAQLCGRRLSATFLP